MKKLMMWSLLLLMLFVLYIPAYAADDNITGLTDVIIDTTNGLFGDELNRAITANDVNYDNITKIYVGVNVFDLDKTSIDDMENVLKEGGYYYDLPIYINGDTVLVSIVKGGELDESIDFTDQERQKILDNIGKWQILSVKLYKNEIINFQRIITDNLGEVSDGTLIVGGLPYFRFPVALIPDTNGNVEGLLPLVEIPGETTLQSFKSNRQTYYGYEQIKNYINQLPSPDPDKIGGYGFLEVDAPSNKITSYVLILGAFVVCIAGVAFIIIRPLTAALTSMTRIKRLRL